MKVKNLTIGKIKEICKSKKGCPKTCPLKDHQWCCLGLRNMTTKELESEITIKPPQRKYYVKFTKYDVYGGNNGKEMRYQNNCGFCVKNLHSYSIKRPFDNENTVVENLVVKEIKTNKIIYQGKDYVEFLKEKENDSNFNEH